MSVKAKPAKRRAATNKKNSKALLVRYRNDGDQYHVLWTIRRVLRLLDPQTHLQGVAIEGIHDAEAVQDSEGIMVVDTAEYYGDSPDKITRATYNQLKYSTTQPDTPWNAAGIADAMGGFSKLYQDEVKQHGQSVVEDNVRFRFVTNRPISENVLHALKAAQTGAGLKGLSQAEQTAYKSLFKGVKLTGAQLTTFASLVELAGEGTSLAEEARQVAVKMNTLTTGLDAEIIPKLSEMVRSLATSQNANSKVVDINLLLRQFGLGTEKDLLPAPATFEQLKNAVPREQEGAIVRDILGSTTPCVIHASGGVGKTVLAQRLEQLLPKGSEVVLFDGFGGGNYRSPFNYRHKHSQGMVQICNELARRGLCEVLVPSKVAGWELYLKPFTRRVEQAAAAVKARGDGAVLLIIVDAADNLGMAASDDALDRSFVWDLMQMVPPDGCRVVALARTERVAMYVKPLDTAKLIPLPSFTPAESLANLRRTYLEATEAQAQQFDRLTSSNPRVQANAIATTDNLDALMQSLGTAVMGPEQLIATQLDDAISKLKRIHADKPAEFDPLCRALAALPPPVPLATLSLASGLSEDAIKSFISDFAGGRPMVLVNGAVQFVDEPVETWFRNRFLPDEKREYSDLADLLLPAAGTDTYVSVALPMVLQRADRYDELMNLALTGTLPDSASPVVKREVVLNRVRYALKYALAAGKVPDTVKLLLRAGEEVAADGRQIDYLMDNADLVTKLSDPSMAREFVFRRQLWLQEMDASAKCAVMLSAGGGSDAEAHRFLSRGLGWLNEKLAQGREERDPFDTSERLKADHVANFLEAVMNLRGIEGAKRFMSKWNPWFAFKVMRKYARRCIDRNETAKIAEMLEHFSGNVAITLAIILEMNAVCQIPDRKHIEGVFDLLMSGVEFKDFDGESVRVAVVCVGEAAGRLGIAVDKIISLLDLYPVANTHTYGTHDNKNEREAVLRAGALRAALTKKPLTLADVMPDSVKKYRAEKAQEEAAGRRFTEHDVEKHFTETYDPLLRWYEYRARAVIGRKTKLKSLLKDLAETTGKSNWRWSRDMDMISGLNLMGKLWADALLWLDNPSAADLELIGKWLMSFKVMIYIPTWTDLARRAARSRTDLKSVVFWFAEKARAMIGVTHEDASSDARCYASLARALMPLSQEEAAIHFQSGVNLLGHLGEESYDRMAAMLSLAAKASKGGPDPVEAYRLGRMAEVFCAHNSHKFPWPDVVEHVTMLDPASAFAFAARLQDRGTEPVSDTIPQIGVELLSVGKLSPQVAASLHAFGGYWAPGKNASLFLGTNLPRNIKQAVHDFLVRDADVSQEHIERNPTGWLDVARAQGLNVRQLEAMLAHAAQFADDRHTSHAPETPAPLISEEDWDLALKGMDPYTVAGINQIEERRSDSPVPITLDAYIAAVRQRVATNRQVDHISAIVGADMYLSHIVDMLYAMNTQWGASLMVKNAIADAARYLIKQRGMEVLTQGWPMGETLRRTAALAGVTQDNAFRDLVAGLADHVEEVSAEWLFQLASMLSREILDTGKAKEALKYGLDRLDLIMRDEDGDGPWSEKLRPPADTNQAIAHFLYAALSDVDVRVRWRAIHAVRRLCSFRQADIIAELVRLIGSQSLPGFRDADFLFYAMHAELHLLVALARSADESPDVLLPHAGVFYRIATGDMPHVVIKQFAKMAALALEKQRPGTYTAEQVAALAQVNVSAHPIKPREGHVHQGRRGWSRQQHHDTQFRFHYDFSDYWAQPLANTFGVGDDAVIQLAEGWIKKWGLVTAGDDKEDARFDAIGYGEDSHVSHGTRGKRDTMSFYASWHALMCAAGELLASTPVLQGYGDGNEWEEWLNGHLLSRWDGRWLSDRRDFDPLVTRSWETKSEDHGQSQVWRYSVQHQDLDSAVGLFAGSKTVVVEGTRFIVKGSRRETIGVRSGLVSPKKAEALLRAAQTSDSNYHYHLPFGDGEDEIGLPGFTVDGWIYDAAVSQEIDEHDPFAGKLQWPGPRPSDKTIELMGLTADDEGREWSSAAGVGLRALLYGDRSGSRDWDLRDYGDILTATPEFLKAFLQKRGCDLILDVSITRQWGSREEENTVDYAYRSYFKVYLLRQDGSIVTLNGLNRLW